MKRKKVLDSTLTWFGYEKNTVAEKVNLIDGDNDGTLTWFDLSLGQLFTGKYGDPISVDDTTNTYVVDDYVQNYFV
jgi:hypothetical protein